MAKNYRIMVYTGSVNNAGTDADVWITLYGTNGSNSGERYLDNSDDNFETGDTDVFNIETRDLGNLKRIRIRHDNGGHNPGWFLDKIIILDESAGQEWIFPCNRWLAYDEDDGRVDRVLDSA